MTLGRSSRRERLARAWMEDLSPAGTRLLAPVSAGYRGVVGAREWLYSSGILRSRRLECPVVSVGNLTVGGTGKTPAVMLAAEALTALGRRPAVVSRGYGRRSSGVHIVADTASIRLDPEEGGDEPFLLARRLPGVPVVVAANRWEGARLAIERFGVTAIVLDDGFQHRTVAKDLEIVMARAHRPWGNGRLLPGGPLREPLSALARAHLVVVTGAATADDAIDVTRAVERHAPGVPVATTTHVVTECWAAARLTLIPMSRLEGARVLAFAGIGFPDGFGRTLAHLGLDVVGVIGFGDHHWYAAHELEALASRARELGACALVTTEKDWVKLLRLRIPDTPLWVVSVRLAFTSGETSWRAAFEKVCGRA
ncbi:MAG: tetraacyldisaccharide 4'-kinase [Candidatus Rokubacteria bacterium]|nr:tetraacyldisaccharide 4'-kinase [Candidatus Rokubacteria bacterium]